MPSLDPEEPTPALPDRPRDAHAPVAQPQAQLELTGIAPEGTVPRASAARSPDPEPDPGADGWALVAIVPCLGREPPPDANDELATAVWCAVSALWHPAILARGAGLPRFEPVDMPSPPGPREIRVVAGPARDRLPSGYRTQAEDAGSTVVEAGADRAALIRQIELRMGATTAVEMVETEGMTSAARDFLAIGTVRFMLRELAIAMGHADAVDNLSLARELMAGAHAWQLGDWASAVNRLRAAFEVLTQARERFYPVDDYLLDICLLDPAMGAGVLTHPLETPIPITFLAPGQAIESQALHDPQAMAALRQAISDGWADVVGGPFAEREDALLPLESILWQFRHASAVYRAHLDDRNVETYARRRFGLYTQLPQIAKRFGFRYAFHVGFDAGRFPVCAETKRLWEGPDGSYLESLMRPPIAADRPAAGWLLPWRLAATMKNDHAATLPLIHWPLPVAPWYLDLRRMATYSPVLGRFTTLNDFFHLTDRPYESLRPEPDDYVSPYLAQGAAGQESDPISRLVRHHRLRARQTALDTIEALARAVAATSNTGAFLTTASADLPPATTAEELIETGRYDEAAPVLDRLLPVWSERLASQILAVSAFAPAATPVAGRRGYLVLNPLGTARRVAVVLPDAALDLRPEGPLRAAQFTDQGVVAVVDLPPFGFAWVPADASSAPPAAAASALRADGRKLRNESIEIEVDATTGGLRGLAALGESTPRLGQQLVVTGLVDDQGKPATSLMRIDKFEVEFGGPALVQAASTGTLVNPLDGARLAKFTERFRLWTGRPILEIEIAIDEVHPRWLERAATADPWSVYLACRWAWPDAQSMIRRSVQLTPEITGSDRPETPDFIDISSRAHRSALLFGGLCYHRKHTSRMLDTILIAGKETARSFTVGVVLEQDHPGRSAQDWLTPAVVVPTTSGPPTIGSTGWLAQVDHKGVAVSRLEFAEHAADGDGWGLIFHLLETAGHAARTRLRLFKNPVRARQVNFLGETIIDLTIDGDAVRLDLTPHELARVEVTMA